MAVLNLDESVPACGRVEEKRNINRRSGWESSAMVHCEGRHAVIRLRQKTRAPEKNNKRGHNAQANSHDLTSHFPCRVCSTRKGA
jgi:hypothetical protein